MGYAFPMLSSLALWCIIFVVLTNLVVLLNNHTRVFPWIASLFKRSSLPELEGDYLEESDSPGGPWTLVRDATGTLVNPRDYKTNGRKNWVRASFCYADEAMPAQPRARNHADEVAQLEGELIAADERRCKEVAALSAQLDVLVARAEKDAADNAATQSLFASMRGAMDNFRQTWLEQGKERDQAVVDAKRYRELLAWWVAEYGTTSVHPMSLETARALATPPPTYESKPEPLQPRADPIERDQSKADDLAALRES